MCRSVLAAASLGEVGLTPVRCETSERVRTCLAQMIETMHFVW